VRGQVPFQEVLVATQFVAVDPAALPDNKNLPPEQMALIQMALFEVLQSTPFKTSKQSQQLLQYIVQQTVRGRQDLLKERIIGAAVFARRADYDTNSDPVVRTRAGEVRKRLAQYYLGEGREGTLRIEINPGSYHAMFVGAPKPTFASLPDANEAAPLHVVTSSIETDIDHAHAGATVKKQGLVTARTLLIGTVFVLLAAATSLHLLSVQKPIDVFWQPLLEAKKPVLIYSGSNAVYMLKSEFLDRYRSTHQLDALEKNGQEFVVPVSPDTKISVADLMPFKNEFVTLGDLSANVGVAALLALHKKSFEMRSGEDVAFSDLHESPSLLVGAFNNRWTMELTGDLPFSFGSGLTIRDRMDKNRSWTPTTSQDGGVILDYAIVTRIPHSKSDQPLVAIAGITQFGTRAAADFITSPQLLNDFLTSAPKDWKSKRMQVVLQTKVVNNIPTAPAVVATRYW
jgi:hypothetical protein